MPRKLILLGGMTPGGKVFKRLKPLLTNYQFIDWVNPDSAKSIQEYAKKIVTLIKDPEDCDVLGVSFGGIVAQELANLINAEKCYIISSLCSREELNFSHKILSMTPQAILDLLLTSSDTSLSVMSISSSGSRVKKLKGEKKLWYRWAASAVAHWEPSLKGDVSHIRVHGDLDATFKRGHFYSDHVIEGATHVLALTHAEELARILSIYR